MPFPPDYIEQQLRRARAAGRLAHAYLLTGGDLEQLQALFLRLAGNLLGEPTEDCADCHIIRPESKSRRLTVEQIRDLEQQLRLKARRPGGLKVAGIVAADRMCLAPAQAANAFLKTLEEPPAHTVIFLLTDQPEQLLPTIRSRCLILQIAAADNAAGKPETPAWARDWLTVAGTPADQAYRRAVLLAARWTQLRDQTEKRLAGTVDDEDALAAIIEAEYLLARDHSLRDLIIGAWQKRDAAVVFGLEELRYALSRNIEQNLALERACLQISGLIEEDNE